MHCPHRGADSSVTGSVSPRSTAGSSCSSPRSRGSPTARSPPGRGRATSVNRPPRGCTGRNVTGVSQWSDLERPPLSATRLRSALLGDPLWSAIEVRSTTTSTNADVAAAARQGAPEGLVVIAEEQQAGRGRLGRTWEAPPRAGVLMSVLLRPAVPLDVLSLLPLLTGTAVVESTRAVSKVHTTLKWPNDVLVSGRKLGGILAERLEDAVVVGIGLNVSTRPEELALPTATSLAIEGGTTDREPLVK